MAEPKDRVHANDVRVLTVSEISKNVGRVISAIKWIVIAFMAYKAIVAVSGKTTDANIVVQVLASSPIKNTGFIIAIAVGFGWGWIERRLRQQKTRYLTRRIQALERQIDPDRTSSTLAATGDTNPRDKSL